MTQPTTAASVTGTEITAEFEVTGWDQSVYDEPGEGPAMARATVRKTFRGGIEGVSVAELLTAGDADGRGYVASERFTGTINGRRGTVVYQHGGLDDGRAPYTFGHIVPGSGTAELVGLAGEITFAHDESGARVTLVLR
ncbi:DUF3224 domain-containing protein [Dactylosporangium fulvum]|uniref:DUF3224 domain-containing protein n=1 Tax=Dactylosporangium fulvum TaxID=53359 RepID=A0ABY5VTF3_9ACTN|nr:DUF3224 domain-containing protein [Dactylosporangium fulvum]UWP80391.1 DUF3224 domain-containing protein [Dactylosporangium fulvum]